AYDAGLRTGDRVGCLSLRDGHLLFDHNAAGMRFGYSPGTALNLCVQRGNSWRPVSLFPRTRPPAPNIYFNDTIAALRIAGYIAFLLCAVFLVLGRPGRATWTFFAYAAIAAPTYASEQNFSVFGPTLFALIYAGGLIANTMQFGLLMQFAVLVPNDWPPRGWRTMTYYVSIALTLLLFVFGIGRATSGWIMSGELSRIVASGMSAIVVITILARLGAMEREERGRFGWAAFAIAWAVILDNLRQSTTLPGNVGSMLALLLVLTPITLMYAILKRHVIDISFAISRTVVYATVMTVLVVAIGAVDWATSTYLHEAKVAMALDALVTIGIAFSLNRLHRRIERSVDFLLFRAKYNAETFLNRLGRTLISSTHEETVDRALVRDPHRRLHLSMAALFRKTGANFMLSSTSGYDAANAAAFEPDHDLVRFLDTEKATLKLGDLTENPFGQACVAIPIHQGPELTGFAVYGIHRDGTALDPDELETLEHLCESAARAYTYIEVSRYRLERAAAVSP
ncbi:MAG TPA: hypothetical protein VIO32_07195, partial [Candidatus Baltobacteraceae bacterium]